MQRLSIFSAVLAAALFNVPVLVQAHIPERPIAQQQVIAVSASEARRIVRRFLSQLGYSRSPGQGGAHLRAVTQLDDGWAIEVAINGSAASGLARFVLHVDGATGQILEAIEPTVVSR